MRKPGLLLALAAGAALSVAGPKPEATLLASLKDHRARGWAFSADRRRLYYLEDSTQVYVLDRTTRQSSRVLGKTIGLRAIAAVSALGDRLAFVRSAEGGGAPQLWMVPLDPATGLANATPRQVSPRGVGDVSFSPDGKSIAFSTPTSPVAQTLVVVPTDGGPERVITEIGGDISPIRWEERDSIYFGLSFDGKENSSKNGVYRVGLSGGTPQFVLRTAAWGAYPGLSPNGRFILAFDSTRDSVVVTTASGRRVDAYKPDVGEVTPTSWSTDGKAIGFRRVTRRSVHIVDLASGRERAIADSAEFLGPVSSPDGRWVATARLNPDTIVLSDLGAGTQRSIAIERPLGRSFALDWFMYWSPDGRFLAYRDALGGINLIDPATSKVRLLAPKSTIGPFGRWRSDSRAILYSVMGRPDSTGAPRTVDVREVTIDGQDRLLHSVTTLCRGDWCGKIVNDSLLTTWANDEYYLTNVRARSTPRLFYKDAGDRTLPMFSPNGRWLAIGHRSVTDERWSIEVMRPDGSARRSVPVAFPLLHGVHLPWISDDGARLFVPSADCDVMTKGACPGAVITMYRVDVATGEATAITSLPNASFQLHDAMIANDGRSLAYVRNIETRADIYELDLSRLLKGGQR